MGAAQLTGAAARRRPSLAQQMMIDAAEAATRGAALLAANMAREAEKGDKASDDDDEESDGQQRSDDDSSSQEAGDDHSVHSELPASEDAESGFASPRTPATPSVSRVARGSFSRSANVAPAANVASSSGAAPSPRSSRPSAAAVRRRMSVQSPTDRFLRLLFSCLGRDSDANRALASAEDKLASSQKRRVFVQLWILFAFCFVYFVAVYAWNASVMQVAIDIAHEAARSGDRRVYAALTLHNLYLLAYNEAKNASAAVLEQHRAATRWTVGATRWAHHGLLYGDPVQKLPGDLRDPPQVKLLFTDACNMHDINPNFPTHNCTTFHHAIFMHGMNSALEEYNMYALQEAESIGTTRSYKNASMHSETLFDFLTYTCIGYQDDVLEFSGIVFREKYERTISRFISARLTIAGVFIAMIGVLLAFVFLPLIRALHSDATRTRAMLLLIPIELIESIKSIRTYIRTTSS